MRYRKTAVTIGGALLLGLPACAFQGSVAAQEPAMRAVERSYSPGTPAEIPLRSKEVGQGFFMVTGRGANSLLVASPEGLILVDTKLMYPSAYAELMQMAQRMTGFSRPSLVYVTHHHADHTGGNAYALAQGAVLVGHDSVPGVLANYETRIAPENPAPPTETFSMFDVRDMGGLRIESYHWGSGHTGGDIAIFFPEQRIVAAGDMVYGSGELAADMIDGNGSLLGMLAQLDGLLRLDFQVLVPGHGDNVLTRAEVEVYRDRLSSLVDRGLAAVQSSVGPDGLRDAMRSDDLGFRLVGHFWTETRFIEPLHRELAAALATGRVSASNPDTPAN
jgi:cyclase